MQYQMAKDRGPEKPASSTQNMASFYMHERKRNRICLKTEQNIMPQLSKKPNKPNINDHFTERNNDFRNVFGRVLNVQLCLLYYIVHNVLNGIQSRVTCTH